MDRWSYEPKSNDNWQYGRFGFNDDDDHCDDDDDDDARFAKLRRMGVFPRFLVKFRRFFGDFTRNSAFF